MILFCICFVFFVLALLVLIVASEDALNLMLVIMSMLTSPLISAFLVLSFALPCSCVYLDLSTTTI